ncbi:ABC transporter permease [Ectothiorhodospira haloalkaliphila]|uniref:ABC transporter permease n=1 Tax=Ectothiorhodospira haloalkaliphila TaxID=421628 RepID=W8KEL2_9GAMM|nr:sugar ABC transporter permease [Ectothiorhodospira haloalkaliphila]AHK78179.1 ABC transporter permease [Ectothiorhodospira haloalkaliphila]
MNAPLGKHPEHRVAWWFMAPALAGLTAFILAPFLLALGMSFTGLRLGSPLPAGFAGLENYREALSDPAFLRGVANNALFALVVVPVQTALGLALALLLNQQFQGRWLFRTLFFMPVVFPLSLVAVIWIILFAPGPDGLLNGLLNAVTLGAWTPRDFLNDPAWALPAIMVTSIWQGTGFQMVVLLAGLQAIPRSLYEAAAVDGAGPWRRFWHVTLPGLRNPLIFVVIVTTILSFRVFDQVRIMTQGGPQDASTTVIHEVVRAAFDRGQVALAAAMSVVFFVLVLGITLLQRRMMRQEGGTA